MSKVYQVIDSGNGGLIAICDTYENAYEICKDYCGKFYADARPEEIENVWIEEIELNTWLF